jgi:hypothetical protein
MYKKPLYFLSDSTLCRILLRNDQQNISIDLDDLLFKNFIQDIRDKTKKKRRNILVFSILIVVAFLSTLLAYSIISQGIFGVLISISIVGFFFFSELCNVQKSNAEFQETFIAIIKKDEILEKVSKQEIFEAIMLRTYLIIESQATENKVERVEKIIRSINKYEDANNKIFRIPIKFASNIGELRHLFSRTELPEWAQEFTQKHSMQNSLLEDKTVKELKKTHEEILA